ncbi:hypothetical protein Tco_0763139 [Tanacetum coccineum]
MTTLADKSLLSGGDNKPPMLEKHLYDSWKSRMELYMMNRPHGRMILASVEKGPLVWPSITEDGVTRLKEYVELTPAEAIQADCDIKAINIILQGLPTEIYALEYSMGQSKKSKSTKTPQVPPSFEETTPPVTHPEEVDETIGIPTEVEPLDYTKLEDIGLYTCSQDLFLSSREVPSFDELEPQPQPFPHFLSLEVDLGEERDPNQP